MPFAFDSIFRFPKTMSLQKLGPFEVLRVLGRGGMGTVYEARDTASGELVALKALAPVYSFDETFRSRFADEIEALLKLDHPNIVRLLSYGQHEGNLFFAMELIHGASLFQEQKRGEVFHWRVIIDIAMDVCAGLRHAHDRGVIHRDLKPGNLMMDESKRVKITDFGIAKSFGKTRLTEIGNVVGTMDFMSPEQARGKAATVRSDLFSLGAVLYSLISGSPPFCGETVEEAFDLLLSPDPPKKLTKLAPDVPRPLARLIHRLLEKDPEKRIATAQATARQLGHVLEEIESVEMADTQVVSNDAIHEFELDSSVKTFVRSHEDQTALSDVPASQSDEMAITHDVKPPSDSQRGKAFTPPGAAEPQTAVDAPSDYFNEITPEWRQSRDDGRDEPESRSSALSTWFLATAFLLLFGLVSFGIWHVVIRVPAADDLLQAIRLSSLRPTNVKEEIKKFLQHYPDHEAVPEVRQIDALAQALRHRNRLALGSSLAEIPRQFIDASRSFPIDTTAVYQELDEFLAIYADNDNLTESDQETVEHAQVIYDFIKEKAEIEIERYRAVLMSTIDGCRHPDNPARATTSLKSLIERYQNKTWAADLVEEARQLLHSLLESHNP